MMAGCFETSITNHSTWGTPKNSSDAGSLSSCDELYKTDCASTPDGLEQVTGQVTGAVRNAFLAFGVMYDLQETIEQVTGALSGEDSLLLLDQGAQCYAKFEEEIVQEFDEESVDESDRSKSQKLATKWCQFLPYWTGGAVGCDGSVRAWNLFGWEFTCAQGEPGPSKQDAGGKMQEAIFV